MTRDPLDAFPWSELMAAALGGLGLSASDFWAMTPRELDAALTGRFGTARSPMAPNAAELRALMQRFPDRTMGDANA